MDKQQVGEKWSSFKTGFARTRHKLLVKVGTTEGTVNSVYEEEVERTLSMFKVIKRINRNCTKYLESLRAYSIEQTELARDIVALYENTSPTCASATRNEEAASFVEKQRVSLDDSIRTYFINPLADYLTQQKEMKARIKELGVRKLDMDRYFREYSKMMEKSSTERSKIANIESKYNLTKEGYNNLCDEMMADMPKLWNDRNDLFELLAAAFIKASAEFYDSAATISFTPIAGVSGIQEENVHTRTKGSPTVIAQQPYNPTSTYTPAATTITNSYSPPAQPAAPVEQAMPAIQTLPVQQTTVVQLNPFEVSDTPVQQSTPVYQSTPVHQITPVQQTIPIPQTTSDVGQMHTVSLSKNSGTSNTARPQPTSTAKAPPSKPIPSNPTPSPVAAKPPSPTPPTAKPTSFVTATPVAKPAAAPADATRKLPGMPQRSVPVPTSAPGLPQAQALFTFNAEEEGELSMKKGDIILLHSMEGDWWEGELNGVKGLLPSNYVRRL